MSDNSGAVTARAFEARLVFEAKASGYVRISDVAGGMEILGPFGKLVIPYPAMTKVTRDVAGSIRLDVSGVRLWFDVSDFPGRMTLFALLQEKIAKHSSRRAHLR